METVIVAVARPSLEGEIILAAKLFHMYRQYAVSKGWEVRLNTGEDAPGMYSALIAGDGVRRKLAHENGIHRLQRVPPAEAQGRVFTSKVRVTVLPYRKAMDGADFTAGLGETIRTYNFPLNRLRDHRINVSFEGLDVIMEGDLDPIIEALSQ